MTTSDPCEDNILDTMHANTQRALSEVEKPNDAFTSVQIDHRCLTCEFPGHDTYDQQCIEGKLSKAAYAKLVGVSRTSITRHLSHLTVKSKELKELAEEIATADVHKGDTYLQLITGLQVKALDALALQDASYDAKSWATVSREARGYLELLGKALDRIKGAPQVNLTQVNIYQSEAWQEVGSILARILAPYPELRIKVSEAFLALEAAHK